MPTCARCALLTSATVGRAIRVSRSINLGGTRSVDLVAQVFNVFGRDNLIGGTGGGAVNTATSNAFGRYTIAAPRQDAEVGISFKF